MYAVYISGQRHIYAVVDQETRACLAGFGEELPGHLVQS
jgi:hypothetical protein